MVFIIRVQSPNGLKRLNFESVDSTWRDLQTQIHKQFGIPPSKQLLSRTPPHNPDYVTCDDVTWSFAMLGIRHGDRFYLKDTLKESASKQEARPVHRLTKECQHGPRGRCLHCSAPSEEEEEVSKKQSSQCDHGPNAKCTKCSDYVNTKSEDVAEWLCNHPDTAFCPKCLPPEDDEFEQKYEKKCECTGTQKCIQCADFGPAFKVNFVPYGQFMAEKRSLCKFKHDDSTICHMCAPPVELSYKGIAKCREGHPPWPRGICDKCRPPNANLKLQKYRHVDGISFKDIGQGERFTGLWQNNPGLQIAAILFGNIIPEPVESQNVGAVRAEVLGMYMPPQEPTPSGVIFLHDDYQNDVVAVADAMDLQPVGWVITTLPRADEKHGEVFLSGSEIIQAGKFQHLFEDEYGHSKFVTMVIQYNDQGQIEPKAYMISDQGVAMERDGLLEAGSTISTLSARKGSGKQYVPSILYKSKAVEPGKDFVPDELIVPVVASSPYRPSSTFKYMHFPMRGGTEADFRKYLQAHATEEYHDRFSDFSLLCFLPQVFGSELAAAVAHYVRLGEVLPDEIATDVDVRLAPYL